MKVPSKIRIGGSDYKVVKVDDLAATDDNDGSISVGKRIIKIDSNLLPDKELQIFFHEILHGIFVHASATETEVKDHEEYIVDLFSKGLAQVFNDNPNLLQ